VRTVRTRRGLTNTRAATTIRRTSGLRQRSPRNGRPANHIMRIPLLPLTASLVLPTTIAAAQCGQAPHVLATQQAFGFFIGAYVPPSPDPGVALLFDLTVAVPLAVQQIDCRLYDDGQVNPLQIGKTAPVDLWVCPTTWTGREALAPAVAGTVPGTPIGNGPWSLAASGTVTVAPRLQQSPIVFAAPAQLAPGTYGVLLQIGGATAGPHPLGPLHPLIPPNPTPNATDSVLTIGNGSWQFTAFHNTAFPRLPLDIILQLHYSLAAGTADAVEHGAGCYERAQSWYETFPAPGAVDVTPGAFFMQYLGANYRVSASNASYAVPTSGQINVPNTSAISLNLGAEWDDAVSNPIALPASWTGGFPFPGGTTHSITVGSNGCLFLVPDYDPYPFDGLLDSLLAGVPRLCPGFSDLDASVAGATMHFETAPGDAYVQVSWHDVPEWNTVVPRRLQVRLFPNGDIVFVYGNAQAPSAAPVLVGFAEGGGTADPGPVDLSALLGSGFFSGDGATRPRLAASARPLLGTAIQLQSTGIRAGAALDLILLAFQPQVPALPLDGLGMPGCMQYVALPVDAVLGALLPGAAHAAPLVIPSDAAYDGLVLHAQAIQLVAPGPMTNPAGVLASNGLCLRIGNL
jgi:hypothetical protein